MKSYGSIILLVVMILVMYLLLIRPQKKREKETNAMRSAVRVGDEIITIGGICGKVVKTKEESIIVQVGADKLKFEMMRWSVSKVVTAGSAPAAKKVEEPAEPEEQKKTAPKRMDQQENDADQDNKSDDENKSDAQ